MDSNHAVQFKPLYPHPHISLYSSPVVSATMPNLSIASGLNLVNASSNNSTSTIGHDCNTISALTTLQTSSTNPTLTLPAAQLMPMTALSNIQFQQMHHQEYVEQTNIRQAGQQQRSKFLHVQITNSTPTMAQNNMIQVPQNEALMSSNCRTGEGISSKKSSSQPEETQSKVARASDAAPSCTKKSTSQGNELIKLEANGDSIVNDLSNRYAIINNGKGFRCLICNREFTQKGNLKTHAMTHLGPTERPYDCETCGKRFTQKGNRDIHVKIHTGTKDHTCPYCDRGFTQRGNLKTHIRSVHTGEKPFSCGHCGKTFSQKANMLTHYRTHDKNSRFACNTCGKTFSQKGNLKTHQQRHVQVDRM